MKNRRHSELLKRSNNRAISLRLVRGDLIS